MSDMLCDLMHTCDYVGGKLESFEGALDRARGHYQAETLLDDEEMEEREAAYVENFMRATGEKLDGHLSIKV